MAVKQNTAEGGTIGVTPTAANSGGGSGDALSQVTVTGAISCTYANNASAHGTQSYRITGTSGDTGKLYLGNTATTTGAFRVYLYLNSLPSSNQNMLQIQSAAFNGTAGVNLTGSNRLAVIDATNTPIFTTASALTATTWYRVELQTILGSDAATGSIYFQYYLGDSTTPIETFSSDTVNTGASNPLRLHMGKLNSSSTLDANFDDIAYDYTATPIGPYSNLIAPIVYAGIDQNYVEPFSTVNLTSVGSYDSDGTIVAYNWTQTAGSPSVTLNGSGPSRTFTAPGTITGTTLTFSLTAEDNDGAISTADTVTITVLPVTERAVVGGLEVPAQISAVKS